MSALPSSWLEDSDIRHPPLLGSPLHHVWHYQHWSTRPLLRHLLCPPLHRINTLQHSLPSRAYLSAQTPTGTGTDCRGHTRTTARDMVRDTSPQKLHTHIDLVGMMTTTNPLLLPPIDDHLRQFMGTEMGMEVVVGAGASYPGARGDILDHL